PERCGHRFCPWIVESHAIHQSAFTFGAEHSRRRVSGLWVPRHAAQLTEPKAKRPPPWNRCGALVHPSRQADRIRKTQSTNLHRQLRSTKESLKNFAKNGRAADSA